MKTGLDNAIQALQRDLIENHPDDAVTLLERLSPAEVARILSVHPSSVAVAVWERLSPDIGIRAIEALPEIQAVRVLRQMDPSRSAAMLSMRDPEARENYLTQLPQAQADELRAILAYPADSAGALMDPRVLLLRGETTVREALTRIRALRRRGMRMLFVVDSDNHLKGQVDIQDIATATAATRLEEIQHPVQAVVNAIAPREEVVEILERYRLTDLPVVDAEERLVGVVRYRSLLAAAENEATASDADHGAGSGPILVHRADHHYRRNRFHELSRYRNTFLKSALGIRQHRRPVTGNRSIYFFNGGGVREE